MPIEATNTPVVPGECVSEKSGFTSSRTGRDVARLLDLAEKLQDACDAHQRRKTMGLAFLMLSLMVNVGLIVVAIIPGIPGTQFNLHEWPLSAIAIPVFTVGIVSFIRFMDASKMYRRDRRALDSIVDMIREVEPSLAKRLQLSMLERAEIRIRLSRLGIGYSSYLGLTDPIKTLGMNKKKRNRLRMAEAAIRAVAGEPLPEGTRKQLSPALLAILAANGTIALTADEISRLPNEYKGSVTLQLPLEEAQDSSGLLVKTIKQMRQVLGGSNT